jgi:hypothetical protein
MSTLSGAESASERESRSPSPSPVSTKRKAMDEDGGEDPAVEETNQSESKSVRREGALSIEIDEEQDAAWCKSGDVTLSVAIDQMSKYNFLFLFVSFPSFPPWFLPFLYGSQPCC